MTEIFALGNEYIYYPKVKKAVRNNGTPDGNHFYHDGKKEKEIKELT